ARPRRARGPRRGLPRDPRPVLRARRELQDDRGRARPAGRDDREPDLPLSREAARRARGKKPRCYSVWRAMSSEDERIAQLLAALAEPTPVPAGGSAAALAVAMGASLLAMAGRISVGHWADAGSCAAQAEALRRRAAPLAHADGEAYAEVLRLRREHAPDAE